MSEQRTCQNCKNPFTIEPEDFLFYERIHVPSPTWCPECRMVRKLVWGNARNLYKRKCGAPGHTEEIISKYAASELMVYDNAYWWSDAWDPTSYGRDYDFSKPFFAQFGDLFQRVPVRNLDITNSVNCDYCTSAVSCKNCYLISTGYMAEDCLYGEPALSRRCVDSLFVIACEGLYDCFACTRCFNLAFCIYCYDCMDSQFLYDCRNCSHCFGCVGLRNKQYYIFNKPYTKEDYMQEMAKMHFGSYRKLQEMRESFAGLVLRFPRKFAVMKNAVNCTGHIIENAKNCRWAFQITMGAENCAYVLKGGAKLKDSYDVAGGGKSSESLYEVGAVLNAQRVLFSDRIQDSFDVSYSRECYASSYLFGCNGLRHKQYCILNTQYTKEEYMNLVPRIMKHMNETPYVDAKGRVYRYGEFFPAELSLFSYNESNAQEYFTLSEAEAESKGFRWKPPVERHYTITKTPDQLPDHISEVTDDILNDVIGCAHAYPQINADHNADKRGRISEDPRGNPRESACNEQCTTAFRIIPVELQFYREKNLPLPRLCPNCRHYERAKWRGPWKLWKRKCLCNGNISHPSTGSSLSPQASSGHSYRNAATHFHGSEKCRNMFETPYAPGRPEIVYCEQCYNAEVV